MLAVVTGSDNALRAEQVSEGKLLSLVQHEMSGPVTYYARPATG